MTRTHVEYWHVRAYKNDGPAPQLQDLGLASSHTRRAALVNYVRSKHEDENVQQQQCCCAHLWQSTALFGGNCDVTV